MTRASSKPTEPILTVGLAPPVPLEPLDAAGELLPPPVEQAPTSTSTDAPRASTRDNRIWVFPPEFLPAHRTRSTGQPYRGSCGNPSGMAFAAGTSRAPQRFTRSPV